MKMQHFSNSPVSRSTFARIQCILYSGVHSANPISVHHGHFHLFHKIHYLLFFSIVLLNIIPTNTSSSPLFSSPPKHKFFLQDDTCSISLPSDSGLEHQQRLALLPFHLVSTSPYILAFPSFLMPLNMPFNSIRGCWCCPQI